MNSAQYLNRINYLGKTKNDLSTLVKLHENHIYHVPFENLDIQHQIDIKLEKDHLFKKIVKNLRGGFCYELNYLFFFLLLELGFDVKIISARLFDGEELGPDFDHMALIVRINDNDWLVDVGFGDLFTKPLNMGIESGQFDGGNYFKIKRQDNTSFLLAMSKNGVDYEKKYLFKTKQELIHDFTGQCSLKQHSPSSYFVKNKVVTLPIANGRKTIFNSKYIVRQNGNKTEFTIRGKSEEERILKNEFTISAISAI